MEHKLDDQLGQTISFAIKNGLDLLLLSGTSKRPHGNQWCVTQDMGLVTEHVEAGNGVALVLGRDAGVVAFDGDDMDGVRALEQKFGSLPTHSIGRPDRPGHAFFEWTPGLSAKVFSEDSKVVADIKGASGKGYVVAPSGVGYESGGKIWQRTWACDARSLQLEPMPEAWREWLGSGRPEGNGAGEQLPLVTHSAPVQTFTLSQGAEAAVHNALVRRDVWRNGIRHEICGASVAELYRLGVDPRQIEALIYEVACNARDGEKRMRMSNVRSTIARINAGQPCRGASTFRDHGLEAVLNSIRQTVKEDAMSQFGPLMACAYGSSRGDRS